MSSFKVQISGPGGKVIFQASSPVSEQRNANYDGYNITHLPTDIWAYRNTSGRKFQITGKLVSRTADEASENAYYINLIRQWVLPDFGNTGATPPIVKLKAYGNDNIKDVTCVLKSYSFQMPDDVDYIYTSNPPMPVIMTINVDLDEAYTAEEITAKKWKIKNEAVGFFENGGAGRSSNSFQIDFGGSPSASSGGGGGGGGGLSVSLSFGGSPNASGGQFRGIASVSAGIPGIGSVIGSFGIGKGIPSNPVGNLIAQSNLISDVQASIASIENNPYIKGISPEKILNQSSQALTQVAAETASTLTDAFGRETALSLPSFVSD